jgi:hypothetical protein
MYFILYIELHRLNLRYLGELTLMLIKTYLRQELDIQII